MKGRALGNVMTNFRYGRILLAVETFARLVMELYCVVSVCSLLSATVQAGPSGMGGVPPSLPAQSNKPETKMQMKLNRTGIQMNRGWG